MKLPRLGAWLATAVAASIFTLEGCAASDAVAPVPTSKVTSDAEAVEVRIGDTRQVSAVARDANGVVIPNRPITWTSQAPSIATVTNGLITPVSRGTTAVVASSEGQQVSIAVTVVSDIVTVEVAPVAAELLSGQTQVFTATLKNATGTVISGRPVSWASSNGSIATINSSAVATAVAPGQTTITATSEGRTGSVTLKVGAPVATVTIAPAAATVLIGATQQLTASLKDDQGIALSGRPISWSSADTLKATVSASGVVTGRAAGQVLVSAVSEGKSGAATITVPPPVETVGVSPSTATILIGMTQQLTAELRAANGEVLSGRGITWASSDQNKVTVSSAGVVTAVATGSSTITATSEGKSGTAVISVPPPVFSISATPASVTLAIGQTQQLEVRLVDAQGNLLSGREVTFSSSDTLKARVSSAGLVRGVAVGSATITAQSEGKTAAVSLTIVSSPPVTAILVAPLGQRVFVGDSLKFSADARDKDGNSIPTAEIVWSGTSCPPSNCAYGSYFVVLQTGWVFGIQGASGVQVIASSGSVTGRASFAIDSRPDAIRLSPTSITLLPAGTQQLSLTSVIGTTSTAIASTDSRVTWTTSNPSTISVSSAGLVSAKQRGGAYARAQYGGRSDSVKVLVLGVEDVATVRVCDNRYEFSCYTDASLSTGAAIALRAESFDGAASRSLTSLCTFTWATGSSAVASIVGSGATANVTKKASGTASVSASCNGKTGLFTVR